MAAIVYQTDKRSGITYAYESISYWDREKKQSRAKRTLIGRVNKETGEIIPTDSRGRKKDEPYAPTKRGPSPVTETARYFYGATYLFDAIGDKLGIADDLRYCFPDKYKQILSIAYYLILEDNNPLSRFEKWSDLHRHPYGKNKEDDKLPQINIALIYLSYIKKHMQDHDLFKSYTLQGVLDKLDVIECFENPGRELHIGELLEKQKELYIDLGVTPPTSL